MVALRNRLFAVAVALSLGALFSPRPADASIPSAIARPQLSQPATAPTLPVAPTAPAYVLVSIAPDGSCRVEFCRNDPVNVTDPTGLFSWAGLGRGVWDVVSEPFKAVSDTFILAPLIGINNLVSSTDLTLDNVQFSSMLASGTRERRLAGESGLVAAGKGYGELGLTVATVGVYPLGKNLGESLGYYVEGDITLDELDYRLSRGAGGQAGATVMASVMARASGRGWSGRVAPSDVPNWQNGPVSEVEPARPALRSLRPEAARQYYNNYMPYLRHQLLRMKVRGVSAEAIARRASHTRNALAQRTRDVMANRSLAESLRPHRPIEYYIEKYSSEGFARDALWQRITEGSLTPNPDVNVALGITGPEGQ